MTPKQQELTKEQIEMLQRFQELERVSFADKASQGWKEFVWKPRQQRGVG